MNWKRVLQKGKKSLAQKAQSFVEWIPISWPKSAKGEPFRSRKIPEADLIRAAVEQRNLLLDEQARGYGAVVDGKYLGELDSRAEERSSQQAFWQAWNDPVGKRSQRTSSIVSLRDQALSLLVRKQTESRAFRTQELQRLTEILTTHRKCKETKATELGVSPTSGKIATHPWWLLSCIGILGYLDYLNHKGTFEVLGMNPEYTNALAILASTGFLLLAHSVGELMRYHSIPPNFKRWTLICVVLLLALIHYAMANWRIQYVGAMSEGSQVIEASLIDILCLMGINFLILLVGGFLSWKGTNGDPEAIFQWNTILKREAVYEKRKPARETKIWTQEKEFLDEEQAVLALFEERMGELEKEDRSRADIKDESSRRYILLDRAYRAYRAQIQSELNTQKYYYQMKSTTEPTQLSPPRHPRRMGLFFLLIGLAFFMGCESPTGTLTDLQILVDHTDSYQNQDQPFDGNDLLTLGAIGVDNDKLYNGIRIRADLITDTYISATRFWNLAPVTSSCNRIKRKNEVMAFPKTLKDIEVFLFEHEGLKPASEVYIPFAKALKRLEVSQAERKILVVASDMADCNSRLCMHREETQGSLREHPDSIRAILSNQHPFPSDLGGVEVFILSNPKDYSTSDQARVINQFWKTWLEEMGAKVHVQRNL